MSESHWQVIDNIIIYDLIIKVVFYKNNYNYKILKFLESTTLIEFLVTLLTDQTTRV